MGERKVLIRYIPPDFDPSIIPKVKRDRFKPCEVRMMLPFSLRCNTCGEYLGRGKKFNSRKETCIGEDYMGIRRIRFVIKCSVCSTEISFKTDPKNSDYECEYGAVRNFELWKESETMKEEEDKRKQEVEIDSMKSLESRTLDSKLEMDVLDALDEIKAINQRHERVDIEGILEKRAHEEEEEKEKKKSLLFSSVDDETILKTVKFANSRQGRLGSDSDEEENLKAASSSTNIRTALLSQLQKSDKLQSSSSSGSLSRGGQTVLIKKKRKVNTIETSNEKKEEEVILSSSQTNHQMPSSGESDHHNLEKRSKVEVAGEEKEERGVETATVTVAATATGEGKGGLFGFGMYGSSSDEEEGGEDK